MPAPTDTKWYDVLEKTGWPTHATVFDFETYSDKEYSLKKMSTVEFVRDPRFEFLGLGIHTMPTTNTAFISGPNVSEYIETLRKLWGNNFEKRTIVAANAKFDVLILKHHFKVNPPYVVDIQDIGRTQDARAQQRLDTMAFDYLGKRKLPDLKQLIGLHWNQLSPTQRLRLKAYTDNDVELESRLFEILLPLMPRPEIELRLARLTLKMYLEPHLRLNFKKAETLIERMNAEMDAALQDVGCTREQVSSDTSFLALLMSVIPASSLPMKQGKKKLLLAISKTDSGREELLFHPIERVRKLMEARVAVKSWPLHIKRIVRMIAQARASKGFIGMPLKYYGAHTGRWSGEERINPQNFGARGEGLFKEVKSLLEAMCPYELTIGDLSQIEARENAFMAGQKELLEGFRNKEDVYSVFASDVFQLRTRKSKASDPPPVRKALDTRRAVGKESILGLGYGMGADKFYSRLRMNADVAARFSDDRKFHEFAEKTVRLYRSKYPEIPKFWTQLEQAFMFVTRYPGESRVLAHAKLILHSYGSTVYITLPSGRYLRYVDCRIGVDKGLRCKYGALWGGTLVENVVQAASRDIIAEQMLQIEEAGYPVVLTVHDSTASINLPALHQKAHDEIRQIMCTTPSWCEGLPLDTDIKHSQWYC